MNIDEAIRLTEILMGFAFAQQSIEHIKTYSSTYSSTYNSERRIFIPRLLLSVLLIIGIQTAWVTALLFVLGLIALHQFQGPYNGGSDRMSLLMLICLTAVQFAPTAQWQELAFGYLALQLVLSYFISGWVKVVNPEWRSGRALRDVFQFSTYPVSESLRSWADSPRMLFFMSWGVILFELLFPFSLYSNNTLLVALVVTASFHFSNACLFGLNRFFWIWISAYPSIIWFQSWLSQRVIL